MARGINHDPENFIRIPLWNILIVGPILPAVSLISCVLLSIYLHWEEVTITHCNVVNYLPSISAAVGDYTPERYIWRIGIALHAFHRFTMPYLYVHIFKPHAERRRSIYMKLVYAACTLHIIENTCLLIMTYISSTENFDVHEKGFIGFVSTSMTYMLLTCFLYKKLVDTHRVPENKFSYRMKVIFMVLNYIMFALSMYFYYRHNTYCERGVYSLFALAEYLVVFSNIAFHSSFVFDLRDGFLTLGPIYLQGKDLQKYRGSRRTENYVA